ncbi:hypothetical protein RHMOL_Rhmol07G0226400 [Rhododendron molle]|uniref:Uncharacterized protein n=1 Tax=Rhododendron molle TaxID=49168 RepID=A0ACC0N523_RHOML|nr:hypothetical protein RHMOL_Rhmol07G0226400 [Rhododendron molle]
MGFLVRHLPSRSFRRGINRHCVQIEGPPDSLPNRAGYFHRVYPRGDTMRYPYEKCMCLVMSYNGCCAPPQYCGFQDKNQSWVIPESGFYAEDINCVTWSSDKTKLCHQCETCQAVYVYVMTFNWHLRGIWLMFGICVWVMCLVFTCAHQNKQLRQQQNNRTNVDNVESNPSVQPDLPNATT